MPDLNTRLHLSMLARSTRGKKSLLQRIYRAVRKEWRSKDIYGLEWGDPDNVESLKFIRDRYVLPYVNAEQRAVEIGPGGGRWTRYMLAFKKLYVVDYHAELLEELKEVFRTPNMVFIKNDGTDFPGIEERSIDYLCSFGTFVHLDAHLVQGYLTNMKPILKSGANVVIQYADKTKTMA